MLFVLLLGIGLKFKFLFLELFLLFLFLILLLSLFLFIKILNNKNVIKLLDAITFIVFHPIMYILLFTNFYKYTEILLNNCEESIFLLNNCEESTYSTIDYLYFSIVTWTTVGYGDLQPNSFFRIYASLEAFIGYLFAGLIIGIIFHIIEYLNNK